MDRLVAALRTQEDRAMVLVMLLGGVAPLRGLEAAVVTVMLKGSVGQPLLHQLLSKKIAPKVRVVSH